MPSLPDDYLETVYAGVLGKLIGVYVGRPFEGWTHTRILNELGPIHYYVHEKCNAPLVVSDDDVSGTFTFVRALEEHGVKQDLSSEEIGKTWLNNVINRRTIFWWGGKGISTEHTAYINLKKGIAAPRSGSIQTNGKTVAEQIGAQIFIDGWAMVAPGNPDLAARLAESAGSVSHDGESVYAAKVWAAMEAEAFVSKDVNHLLDIGLKYIPSNSLIATLIADVRHWSKDDGGWKKTRQRIEDKYGYDKFCGICHVVPNHAIMIMTLIYAGHDFHEAMHIINTCGWDTDCNSGNVGCLVAIMHGLSGFDGDGPDWRGPLADRALISSADAGYSFNNAVRIAYDIVNMGRQLAGEEKLKPPKDGAQFHFTLPGSVQGFQATQNNSLTPYLVKVEQDVDGAGPGLAIRLFGLTKAAEPVEVLTQTFSPLEVRDMRTYDLVGSPLIYPGQTMKAMVRADRSNTTSAQVRLMLKAYTYSDDLETHSQDCVTLEPGKSKAIEWSIPTSLGSKPIQSVGLAVSNAQGRLEGTIWLDYLRWDGSPNLRLKPDAKGANDFWRRSFVNGADNFGTFGKLSVAQDFGEGIVSYGTREWTDYKAHFHAFTINIGEPAGVAVRVQGLNRYYALVFTGGSRVALVKALDEQRIELAGTDFGWKLDTPYEVTVEVQDDQIRAKIGTTEVVANDPQYRGGGIGLVATDGSIRTDSIEVGSLK